MESRTLISLETSDKRELPYELLYQSGWHTLTAHSVAQASSMMDVEAPCVGLILFAGEGLNGQLQQLEQLLSSTQLTEWIGLIEPHLLDQSETRRIVANYLSDYHTLPSDGTRLLTSLGHAHGMSSLRRAFLKEITCPINGYKMIAASPSMQEVFRHIDKIASVEASVMVGGESGTGKELVARAIHNHSSRRDEPFIAVNCGAIPDGLVQSELFGHEKGTFSGAHQRRIGRIEAANKGTIFLDEIGDLPLDQQVNLLRFLQDKKITRLGSTCSINVDVRVITATHHNLEEAVANGSFREDLYYRLHVLSLVIPPLRERREDIAPLANYFLDQFRPESKHKIRGFSADALQCLLTHRWPGNVRELINRIERAVVMCDQELIEPADLEFGAGATRQQVPTLSEARASAERQAIDLALGASDQNISEAAQLLGVSRVTLYRLMSRLAQ